MKLKTIKCVMPLLLSVAVMTGCSTSETFKVTFETNGGSAVEAQTVRYGSKATRPNNPTKDDYNFDDWYTTNQFTEKFNFDTAITRVTTIYANWIIDATSVSTEEELVKALTEGKNVILTNDINLNVTGETGLTVASSLKIFGNNKKLNVTINSDEDYVSGIVITNPEVEATPFQVDISDLSIVTTLTKSGGHFESILLNNAYNATVNLTNVSIEHEDSKGYGFFVRNSNEIEAGLLPVTVNMNNVSIKKAYNAVRNHGNNVTLVAKNSTFSSTNTNAKDSNRSATICIAQYPIYQGSSSSKFGRLLNADNNFSFDSCEIEAFATVEEATVSQGQTLLYALSPLNNQISVSNCTYKPASKDDYYVALPYDDIADLGDSASPSISEYCGASENAEIKAITNREELYTKFPACSQILVDGESVKSQEGNFRIGLLDENGDWDFER